MKRRYSLSHTSLFAPVSGAALLLIILVLIAPARAQTPDSAFFAGLKARSIGPAGMSGRVAVIEAAPSNPDIVYVGAATGGVWKSANGGMTWTPVFDEQPASSIGAIALSPQNPNVVWVGTGEGNVRNSAGVGRGIFRSLDGGKTWKSLGLEKTERIHRIILHPTNPDVALAAAMGPTWGDGAERGVFKTTDGGKTWRKVLYANEKTGAAELVANPSNPNQLLCGMWQHRREPWFFTSGGGGSGLYSSSDGGETWKKLAAKDGLPEGELGRMGLAFAPSNPNVAYALVEAKESALLRSDDGGAKWRVVNKEPGINPRPFYYADIRVHPKNENFIYRLQTTFDYSIDGGKSFQNFYSYSTIHPDHHALWVHPDGSALYVGNDGGVAISRDGGKRWQFVDNLPLGQFYHVAVDNDYPYNIYGGLQDNGSWRGPSNSFKSDGIFNGQWEMVGFGDGFATVPDPENNEFCYAMSQGGALMYSNVRTGVRKAIRPTETGVKHRYNWNAGIALDPFNPKALYYGSQFLHKSLDKGHSWQIISPDLTTNDPAKQKGSESGGLTRDATAAENHCTILSIAPSALKEGVIWVATDDGNVQLTQDGGKTWSNVSPANSKTAKVLGGAAPAAGAWSPHVEASRHDPATAFLVFDDHRRSNWTTYAYATRDYGKTWTSLATKDLDGFCHVVRQDPVEPNLLFVGTEFGLFTSFDGGKSWTKWVGGLPTVPVTDIVVHPREHDLVIATHGRGLYVLDDIRPLRELAKSGVQPAARKPLHLFAPSKGSQYATAFWAGGYVGTGHTMFKGQLRQYGALVTYAMNPPDSVLAKEGTPKEQKLDIQIVRVGDKDTTVMRTLKGSMKKGLNRVAWNMERRAFDIPRRTEQPEPRRGGFAGGGGSEREEDPEANKASFDVLPGAYYARVKYGGAVAMQPFEVEADPRVKPSMDALKQIEALQIKTGKLMDALAKACKQILAVKKSAKAITDFAKNGDKAKADSLSKRAKSLEAKLDSLLNDIVPEDSRVGGIFDRSTNIMPQMYELSGIVGSSYDPPPQAALVKYDKVRTRVEGALKKLNDIVTNDVAAFRKEAESAGVSFWGKTDAITIQE